MINARRDRAMLLASERSIADQLKEAAASTEIIIRGEARLALLRMENRLSARATQFTLWGVAAVLSLAALGLLLIAAVALLTVWLPLWFAAATVSLSTAAVAAVLARVGASQTDEASP